MNERKLTGRLRSCFALCLLSIALAACHTISPSVRQGAESYAVTGTAEQASAIAGDYRIGPLDELRLDVLYEPELSVDPIRVDANGNIAVPLLGNIRAAGKTAEQLSAEIQAGLGARYLRDPKVSLSVITSPRQRVTVEGEVEEPGVYDIAGSATLLEAVARAQGPTKSAKLNEVIVFRIVNGQRMAAVFDLRQIRRGFVTDPLILGGDTVVVGYSELKGAFRDFIAAAPAVGVFRPY